jgi:hypothetical protein
MLRASDATDPFQQMQDTAKFLRRYRATLVKTGGCPQVEELWLEIDFPMHGAKRLTSFMVTRVVVNQAAELSIKFVITAVPRALARFNKQKRIGRARNPTSSAIPHACATSP